MKHNKTNNTNIAATLAAALIMIFALLLTPTAARAQAEVYLESGEMPSTSVGVNPITRYPANGSFTMQGISEPYSKGITNGSGISDSTATYSINGRGFTRLVGTLGRVAGSSTGDGWLTVTAGSGNTERLLGGYCQRVRESE